MQNRLKIVQFKVAKWKLSGCHMVAFWVQDGMYIIFSEIRRNLFHKPLLSCFNRSCEWLKGCCVVARWLPLVAVFSYQKEQNRKCWFMLLIDTPEKWAFKYE